MAVKNDKPSSPRRWLDSQTGIPGSSTNSVAADWHYRGWKHTKGENFSPLPFRGYRCYGNLVRGIKPALPPGYVTSPTFEDGFYFNRLWAEAPSLPQEVILAQNRAWDRLMDKVKGDTSSLAAAAAERRETFDMVANRVMGLYRAYKALRKGDFRRFLRELSVDPKRKHRSRVRTGANEAAGIWLEYWFGWSPTIQDIGSAIFALDVNPVLSSVVERAGSSVNLPDVTWDKGDRVMFDSGRGVVRHGARFTLVNSNLFLANRLGLVNPVSVAWELVPFSFVVDWFSHLGSYLQSFTDLAGLDVSDQWSVRWVRCTSTGRYFRPSVPANYCEAQWRWYYTFRDTALFHPLPVRPRLLNFGHSNTRAATAVSLLTSLFLKG